MKFVDSHCHLNFEDFGGDVDAVLKAAQAQGISTILNICTKLDEIEPILGIVEKSPELFCTVGIHPHEAEPTLTQVTPEALKKWLLTHAEHPKVVGFGETGLDFYYDHSPRDLQKEVFRIHIEAALETGLPLSVHTRNAEEETIRLLKEAGQGKAQGVLHCFSGTRFLAEAALDLGFYISVSGIITFKKAEDIRETIRSVPLDRLLLETDAPYLAPVPHRGKRNEPALMIHTAKVVADLKGLSLAELARITTENFFMLFSKAQK